jgi:site-specific DNA recombinase
VRPEGRICSVEPYPSLTHTQVFNKMKGIIYCRVSSKEQIEGTSLEVQETACRDYARVHSMSVERVFVEQGESAKFADRTQLLELIEFCRLRKGDVNVLIVWKLDRFARNVTDHYSIKATLSKYGVRVVSVTEPIDSKPEGKLLETILAGFAQFDNDIRAVRTVQGMRRRLQEGLFPWGPPYGYKSVGAGLEKKTRPDVPDTVVFPVLQTIWREFATGIYTQADVRRLMDSWGLKTAKGRPFSPQTVYQIFTNPYYAGVLKDPWNGQEYPGQHTPMVTPEEFARVQEIIKKRNRSLTHLKVRPEFPLRGFIRCEACRRPLTASSPRGNGGRYFYYHCRDRTCRRYGKSAATDDIHTEFASNLDRIALNESAVNQLEAHLLAALRRRTDQQSHIEARKKKRRVDLENEVDELIRMRAQKLITDEEFLRRKSAIAEQCLTSAAQRHAMPTAHELSSLLHEITAPLVRLRESWETLAPGLRQRFQRLVFPVGFIRGQVGTAQTARIFNVLSSSEEEDSLGVPLTSEGWNQIVAEIHEFHKVLRAENLAPVDPDDRVPMFS